MTGLRVSIAQLYSAVGALLRGEIRACIPQSAELLASTTQQFIAAKSLTYSEPSSPQNIQNPSPQRPSNGGGSDVWLTAPVPETGAVSF
jgi:hypothetical protein